MAASVNSNCAPGGAGPRNLKRPSRKMRFRCANSISTFLRCSRRAVARFYGCARHRLRRRVAFNIWAATQAAFDPYPFILLNLVLSCLAAMQAPVIMMSQKRQEAKDRLRSENDYRINLKAELEIRHLHEKMDHLINRQWERLTEIQQIQLEIMQDLVDRRR